MRLARFDAVERLEQILLLIFRDAVARIGDLQQRALALTLKPNIDLPAVWRVFDGVADQVGDRFVQFTRIAVDRSRFNLQANLLPASLVFFGAFVDSAFQQLAKLHACQCHIAVLVQPFQREDVGGHLRHPRDCLPDGLM